jgi:hypothetical protein
MKMNKLLLSFALFFASFVVSADTLTIDGQGIATYTMQIAVTPLNSSLSRTHKVWCPSAVGGLAVTPKETALDTSNLSGEISYLAWIDPINSRIKPVPRIGGTTNNVKALTNNATYTVTRFGTTNSVSNLQTVTLTIGCYKSDNSIVPIAPIIAPLSNLNGYIQPIN